MNRKGFRLPNFERLPDRIMIARAKEFRETMLERRSVRNYSPDSVNMSIIGSCLSIANSAPSGANRQPWHFVVVTDDSLKKEIRHAAEAEEQAFYRERASKEWLNAIAPMSVNENKPFLEEAPCLIVIFAEQYIMQPDGRREKNYYVSESVGIATGFLIAALHNSGLATLTHTPSPMQFLGEILERPRNEKAFLILVTGYPARNAVVPEIAKKPLRDVVTFR